MFWFLLWIFISRLLLALLSSLWDYSLASSMITTLAYVLVSLLDYNLTSSVGFFIIVVNLFVGFFGDYFAGLCFGFLVGLSFNFFRWFCYILCWLIRQLL